MSEIFFSKRGGFSADASVVSFSDIGEEISGTGAGGDNRIDSGRGINSDVVNKLCEEKYETDSKNVTYAYIILLVVRTVTPISFLSSRIPNKNTFDRPRR